MRPTDQMLARISGEIEDKQNFIDGIVEDAEKTGRDLTPQEMEMVTRARDRQGELNEQAKSASEAVEITLASRERLTQIGKLIGEQRDEKPREIEYRSAGAYINDWWKASLGDEPARERLTLYERAAAHQTTTDNPGLLPTPIVQPVINFIDASRPITSWLGPRQIPSNTWVRPKVTQHSNVAVQSAEKSELVSQKLTIAKQTVTASTYGGYLNISRQDLDWSTPNIMDIVVNDLAGIYAQKTEAALGAALIAAAPTTETIPTGAPTEAALNAALWEAAGLIFTATAGQGRLAMFVSADHLGLWAPLFAPINPANAVSPGFEAADFGTGAMGQISGIPVYMSAGLAAGSTIVLSSSAAEVYEDRIGSLSVVEPSVLGVQVAYAGYYTWLVVETAGLAKIVKTA